MDSSLSQVSFILGYSGTSQIRTSRIRLPPQYDRFFIDGFFFLLCLSKSYLPNKITSQTRYTMMKIGRNTIGHNFFSTKKSYLRVNYRQIDHDGVGLSVFRGFCPPLSLDNATRMMSPALQGKSLMQTHKQNNCRSLDRSMLKRYFYFSGPILTRIFLL